MKKTAFKTFVCSFVFSLFILFIINGLFFYTPAKTSQDIKIPSKNISLFFMGDAGSAVSARVRPIKKIALRRLQKETPPAVETVYAPAQLPNPSAEPVVEKSPQTPDTPPFDIPLEIASADIAEPTKELVSADFDRIMNTPPPVYDISKEETVPTAEKTLAEAVQSQKDNPAQPEPLKRVISITDPENEKDQGGWDTGDDDYTVDENELHEPKPLLTANNEIKEPALNAVGSITDSSSDGGYDRGDDDYSTDDSQSLLIPLQKDMSEKNDGKFKVVQSADKDQIAMVSNNMPISSMMENKKSAENVTNQEAETTQQEKKWESMAEKQNNDTPWVAAKGTKFPKNNAILDAKYYKDAEHAALEAPRGAQEKSKEVKLAAEMVQNILIPIPEDILNEKNLVPQLETPKKEDNEQTQEADVSAVKDTVKEAAVEKSSSSEDAKKKENKGGLLKSLTSLFSGSTTSSQSETEQSVEEEEDDGSNSFVDRITGRLGRRKKNDPPTKILPAEMRLAFQPNRAEISGTTLKWIQAFANKVNSDRSVILEIRIDGTSSYALQQKRLNLLHNILTNKGVDYRKINTVFTTREPNSFIIRTVRINSNIDRDMKERSDQAAYYQSW